MDKEQQIRMWSMLITAVIYGNKNVDFSEVIGKGIPEMIGEFITDNTEMIPKLFDL